MQNKPTELRLNNAEHLVVYVNDMVVGECTLGLWLGDKELMAKVDHARRLEAIPLLFSDLADKLRNISGIEDHFAKTSAGKQEAFAEGLLEGLGGRHDLHSACTIPIAIPSKGGRSYQCGWEYGLMFRKIGQMIVTASR